MTCSCKTISWNWKTEILLHRSIRKFLGPFNSNQDMKIAELRLKSSRAKVWVLAILRMTDPTKKTINRKFSRLTSQASSKKKILYLLKDPMKTIKRILKAQRKAYYKTVRWVKMKWLKIKNTNKNLEFHSCLWILLKSRNSLQHRL